MRTYTVAFALLSALIVLPSCTKTQPESISSPELYSKDFGFEYKLSRTNIPYLVPVAHNSFSEDYVLRKVKGQGWKTAAVYKINMDKAVVKEFGLVTGDTVSSFETYPDCLIFSSDGLSVSFYEPWGREGSGKYETDPFEYDAADNSITLPPFFVAKHGRGKLVYLSSDIMVCVCTHDKDYNEQEIIYMEIFQRVSKSERQSWVKQCPNYGIRI